MFDFIS